jgi:type VI secretion system secreted protein VgrG
MEQIDIELECAAMDGATALRLALHEGLSIPTTATLLLHTEDELDLEAALGKEAIVRISVDGAEQRRWTLVVTSLQYESSTENAHHYTLELQHELALLALRSDVRMFQKQSSKDIVASVLEQAGIASEHVKWQLERTLEAREYCVQHRETDLNFVSRQLEREGIFYVASATDTRFLLLTDRQSTFEAFDGADGVVPLVDGHGVGAREFEVEHAMTTDALSLRDYHFQTPQVDLTAEIALGAPMQGQMYEFPAGYTTRDEGKALREIRAQEVLARRVVGSGMSDQVLFRPGTWFELSGAMRDDLCVKYALREVTHFVRSAGDTEDHAARDRDYENRFVCAPLDQPYRPQRSTPEPRIAGSETVVVTGPSGSEIHTDEYGRMTGKFFWDRVGKKDDTSSCWMRVLQHPIGGSMALARVNWEMNVRFLYGDPDRPVATYRIDNAAHTAPYAYPAAASAMSFKTHSSPGAGKHNEIAMEDGGGGMKFGFTASKDFNEQVNNDKTEKITVNEKLDVGINQSVTINANQTVTVGAMLTKKVGGDAQVAITGDRTKTVGAAEIVTVSGAAKETIVGSDSECVGASHITLAAMGISRTSKGSHSLTVGGAMISAAGLGVGVVTAGARSETVGAVKLCASGGSITESVMGAMALTVGGVCVNTAAGNHAGSAKTNSTVTVGGVALANAAGQLTIKAKTINITAGALASFIGGGTMICTPAAIAFAGMVTLKGSSSVKIQGAPNLVG